MVCGLNYKAYLFKSNIFCLVMKSGWMWVVQPKLLTWPDCSLNISSVHVLADIRYDVNLWKQTSICGKDCILVLCRLKVILAAVWVSVLM